MGEGRREREREGRDSRFNTKKTMLTLQHSFVHVLDICGNFVLITIVLLLQ